MENELVRIEIDGQKIEVEKGTTILEAAKKLGIEITTLCYHKAFTAYGACRLCSVEITRRGRKRLVTSCNYPVEDCITVETDSPRVRRGRKMILELLLSKCPQVKVIQDLAREMGIEKTRFTPKNEDCILCGSCIRACEEAIGSSIISFVNRGINREVSTPFHEISPDCIACGACQYVCPTGAIKLEKFTDKEIRPLTSDFNVGLSGRGNIYIAFPQGVPNVPVIDSSNCIYHLRGTCKTCQKSCEAKAIDFEQKEEILELDVGAIVVATGFDLFDASVVTQYGYGRYENVITSLEYERLICANGPTEGHLRRLSDGGRVKRIGFIQCVGSRNIRMNRYCSSVCCMHATKEAILANEHDSEVRSFIFFTDLRAIGKGFREYVGRAEKEYQVTYVRGRVAEIIQDRSQNPIICSENTETGEILRMPVDLAVLATSLIPREGVEKLAQILGVKLDHYRFFQIDPLSPTDTSKPGIFVCGYCAGPADIPESVAQASAAAARAAEVVAKAGRRTK